MKKVGIFTWHDVVSAYSCLFYLKKELDKEYKVDLWGFSPKKKIQKKNQNDYFSFTETWYGTIRRVRVYLAKMHVILMARKYDVLIINDLDFFRAGYIIKKIYSHKIIIHYNTEIHGTDVVYPRHTISFYEKHASYPDMIIECLDERAEYRKSQYNIEKKIYVIDNTIPSSEISQSILKEEVEVSKYFTFENNLPILIYAGGCNLSRNLGDIIDSANIFEGKLNYLFFCYGSERDFGIVQHKCDQHKNCHLYSAVGRELLLNIMNKCDIGIQYYDPNFSINHYLASPSKFYEYISVGLNVLSSKNHGIDRMIEEYNLGICFDEEEGIVGGLERLLNKGITERSYIINVFNGKLCYEINSRTAIDAMKKLINGEINL